MSNAVKLFTVDLKAHNTVSSLTDILNKANVGALDVCVIVESKDGAWLDVFALCFERCSFNPQGAMHVCLGGEALSRLVLLLATH